MSWWAYICVMAALIIICFAVAINGAIFAAVIRDHRYLSSWRYNRKAKRHNKKARELRLAKTTYFGYPLPTGTSGSLTITEEMQTRFPVSLRQLEKVMLDRADDLGVDLYVEQSRVTPDIVIRWSKPKRRKR